MVLPPKQFLQRGVYLAASTIHQAMYHEKIKAPRAESSERCTLIFRFPAGFGTFCFRTGCRASQGLSPQPLLISRYSVVTFSILSLLRQIVKKSITLFRHYSEIDGAFPCSGTAWPFRAAWKARFSAYIRSSSSTRNFSTLPPSYFATPVEKDS